MCAAESTGVFAKGVGRVGKHGQVLHIESEFSNCPELHSPVLEKRTIAERRMDKGFEQVFQFSSVNDGDYGE